MNPGSAGKEEEVLYSYLSASVEDSRCLQFWKEFEKNAWKSVWEANVSLYGLTMSVVLASS